MIVENHYPEDSRVRKEATAVREQYDVTVFAVKRAGQPLHAVVDGVEVYRIPEIKLEGLSMGSRGLQGMLNKLQYMLQYMWFTSIAAVLFLLTYPSKRYRVVHANNPPDTLFMVGILCKCLGSKFVYDHHDLAPELYLSRFKRGEDLIYKILLLCERLSCRMADVVIATNESYKQLEVDRHRIPPEKIFVVRNDPLVQECRLTDAQPLERFPQLNGRKMILFLGCVNPQDGVDLLLRVIQHLVFQLKEKDLICIVIGDGDSLPGLKEMARELQLEQYVNFLGFSSDREQIKWFLHNSDVCVEPAPTNPLNDRSTFIKVMEYMAAGKPVVAFDLPETSFSINGSGLLVRPEQVEEFAECVKTLLDNNDLRIELGRRGMQRVEEELNWPRSSAILLKAYCSL